MAKKNRGVAAALILPESMPLMYVKFQSGSKLMQQDQFPNFPARSVMFRSDLKSAE